MKLERELKKADELLAERVKLETAIGATVADLAVAEVAAAAALAQLGTAEAAEALGGPAPASEMAREASCAEAKQKLSRILAGLQAKLQANGAEAILAEVALEALRERLMMAERERFREGYAPVLAALEALVRRSTGAQAALSCPIGLIPGPWNFKVPTLDNYVFTVDFSEPDNRHFQSGYGDYKPLLEVSQPLGIVTRAIKEAAGEAERKAALARQMEAVNERGGLGWAPANAHIG